jgi:outer membrane protein OmpA-like peptidoglycan-associated protein
MITTRMLALPAFALVAILAGCNDKQKAAQADLLNQNEELTKQLEDGKDKLNAMGEQLARVQQQANDLQSQLEACNQRAGAPAPAEKATVADAKDFQGIDGVEATVQDGDIHLTIANSLLFDSGKTSLKDTSKKSLDKVASTIREKYGTREILVVGYTDSDPIRRSTYTSNYHLGFERAYSVRGYLDHKGVTGSHMGLVSFGPDRPDGSKEKSRRVEVIVTSKSATSNDGATAGIESPRNTPAAADKVAAPKSTTSAAAARSTGSKSAASTSSVRKASTGRTASSTASGSTASGSTASGK